MKNTPEVKASPQTGYRIPGYLLVVYASLLFALGWFGHQRWADISPSPLSNSAAAIAAPPAKMATVPASAAGVARTSTAVTADENHPGSLHVAAENSAPQTAASGSQTSASSQEATPDTKPAKLVTGWQTAKPGELPYIAFSAHVYTSDPDKRSVTLNGERYREGDSPYQGLVIEQIEQDMVIFSFNGEPFILDSLQDWPGGKPGDDAAQGNEQEPTSKPEKTVRTTKK
ncbi:type II secretion system assembly factor GspB [Dickeya dadantii subsp. dieffenbachiae]|uniref:type II secretion system assembly factor GspB n=1 Tax=Dickeya dadantii TaxID=204038 RepID=UPI0003A973C5|nr:type II secretion system assembly factor GspB [Dickeya dadantii]